MEVSVDDWFGLACALMDQNASLPKNLVFPTLDLGDIAKKFAKDNGMAYKDVSPLLNRMHNESFEKTWKCYAMVASRSKKHPRTLHTMLLGEGNIEAMAKYIPQLKHMEKLIQMDVLFDNGFQVLKLKDTLHAMFFVDGACVNVYSSATQEGDVRALLNTLRPDEECPVCLEPLLESCGMFKCAHQLCVSCCRAGLEKCPVCDAKRDHLVSGPPPALCGSLET